MYSRNSYKYLVSENEISNRNTSRGFKISPRKIQTIRGESTSWTLWSFSFSREIVNWAEMYRSEPKQRTPRQKKIFQLSTGQEKLNISHQRLRTHVLSTLSKMKLKNYELKWKLNKRQLFSKNSVLKTSKINLTTPPTHIKQILHKLELKMISWERKRIRR